MRFRKEKDIKKSSPPKEVKQETKGVSPVMLGFVMGALVVVALNALVIGLIMGNRMGSCKHCADVD